MIREGTYHEILDVKHSGTDGKPITFRNYENENVVISGESVTDAEYEKHRLFVFTINMTLPSAV